LQSIRWILNNLRLAIALVMSLVMSLALAAPAAAQDSDSHASSGRNHISIILGGTEKGDKTATTYGIEYTYRLNDRWALGGWYEESTGTFELNSLGMVGSFYVTRNFPLILGLGTERELFGENKYLLRAGLQYQFHAGPISISPTAWMDFVEDGHELFFYGATFGFSF
jgi:hypothetical protein